LFLRSLFVALLCLLPAISAAWAEDWSVQNVEGAVSVFTGGEWSAPRVGTDLPANAVLQTTSDGRILILRGADRIDLAPSTKLRVEGDNPIDAIARQFEGVIGVGEAASLGKRFLVVTPDGSMQAKGAVFGVAVDARAPTVSVVRGLVTVTNFAGQNTVDVTDGQVFRILHGPAGIQDAAPPNDLASIAAKEAAARIASNGADGKDADKASVANAAKTGEIDPKSVGALKDSQRQASDAKMAEDAAAAAHEERRKAKLGKADPKTVAAVRQIESDLLQGIDVDSEPLDDNFQWTEVEDGKVRLKPLWRVILGLSGGEAFEFWALWVVVCLLLGVFTSALMKDVGMGPILNTAIVMLAFAAAILVRDAFFREASNIAIEPFMSVGMMLGAMPLLLLGGAFTKFRLG
jgi:hypothetical protein